MARGWESKAVEDQQQEAVSEEKPHHGPLTPEQIEAERKLAVLKLSRAQVARELEATAHDRRRVMLQKALADLDAKIGRR